jgi:hypothetical protein
MLLFFSVAAGLSSEQDVNIGTNTNPTNSATVSKMVFVRTVSFGLFMSLP